MRLSASDLCCARGGREVFRGLSFAVRGGEALAITGPNGVGKSSLLRLLAGLVPIAAGRVAFEGRDPELTLAEQAHYLGHQDALKTALSVAENLAVWARYLDGDPQLVAKALCRIGIGGLADVPAAYLSAGQRRRLALGRLVVAPRPVWLLDEPNAALDTAGQTMLAVLMGEHLDGGGLILASTHGPLGLSRIGELRLEPLPHPEPAA